MTNITDIQKMERIMKYLGGMQDNAGSNRDLALHRYYYNGWCTVCFVYQSIIR